MSLVTRGDQILRADPRRVLAKLFLPGQEVLANGISRADAVILRVLAMTDQQVADTLDSTLARFSTRHHDLAATLVKHFDLVAHRMPADAAISANRRQLIGAYFTQEYSVEAAALFNPSMVQHPDQSGLAVDQLRFIMSVRAVGEGHISSIEFRTGTLSGAGQVRFDEPGERIVTGEVLPATMSRAFLHAALADRPDAALAHHILGLLPERFETAQLDSALESIRLERLTRGSGDAIISQISRIAACTYRLQFDPALSLSERVIFPYAPDECNGIEDARFTLFTDDDGTRTYFGTYTAYDGAHIAPHVLATKDFQTFDSTQLAGPAAKNKGMAFFPRKIDGKYLALSRWDRESIGVASSADGLDWGRAVTIQTPEQPWEVIQLGNCGPPLETEAGWLVLTHGVGPLREYAIGAVLLHLEDPTKMIGALTEPLLVPTEDERDGYVPNVVYSCGGLVHGTTLVLPYGCSDSSIRVAFIDVPELLARLTN